MVALFSTLVLFSVKKFPSSVGPECFSFAKTPIYKEPFEIVRFTKKTSKKKKKGKAGPTVKLMDKEMLDEIELIKSFANRATDDDDDDDGPTSNESTPSKRADSPEAIDETAMLHDEASCDVREAEPESATEKQTENSEKPEERRESQSRSALVATESQSERETPGRPETPQTADAQPEARKTPMQLDMNFLKKQKKKNSTVTAKRRPSADDPPARTSIFDDAPVTGKRKRSKPARWREYADDVIEADQEWERE